MRFNVINSLFYIYFFGRHRSNISYISNYYFLQLEKYSKLYIIYRYSYFSVQKKSYDYRSRALFEIDL